ncbi:peptidoglycan-binding protein [Pedobacter nyackensis]|uniref:peptidoglycan-binding protein n=1 Tax=Pedobacter nyackensis TaxID=475255 RepID=UPI002930BD91|nr:peptidoglycan-binding protein [Pedobacter nyackensis]
MAAVRFLLGFFCFIITGSRWGADRNFISDGGAYQQHNYEWIGKADPVRKKILAIAEKEVGVQESDENAGPRVDEYNAYVGFKKVAWCASFVSWVFGQAGHPQPRSAWSPAIFPADRIAKNPVAGMVMGIYFPKLKRIAHCGIVTRVKGELIFSIEGNTNLSGSREGNGVYRRIRHVRSIYRFADWLHLPPLRARHPGAGRDL